MCRVSKENQKHETIEMTTRIAMLESGRVADWFATGRFHGLGIGRRLSYPILSAASILFPIAPSQGRSQESLEGSTKKFAGLLLIEG